MRPPIYEFNKISRTIGEKIETPSDAEVLKEESRARSKLAEARTILAYDRTTLSALGISIAVAKLFDVNQPLVIATTAVWIATAVLLMVVSWLVTMDNVKEMLNVFYATKAMFLLGIIMTSIVSMTQASDR